MNFTNFIMLHWVSHTSVHMTLLKVLPSFSHLVPPLFLLLRLINLCVCETMCVDYICMYEHLYIYPQVFLCHDTNLSSNVTIKN